MGTLECLARLVYSYHFPAPSVSHSLGHAYSFDVLSRYWSIIPLKLVCRVSGILANFFQKPGPQPDQHQSATLASLDYAGLHFIFLPTGCN